MAWYELDDGGFVNLDLVKSLGIVLASGSWFIQVPDIGTLNCGPYANTTDAQEAIRKLVSGVLPGTIV